MTPHILVVEDNEQIREIMMDLLVHDGWVVHLAFDGVDGLEQYIKDSNKFAAVSLDLDMPRMGGAECLHNILEINPEALVVIFSSSSPEEQARICPGAKAFLEKPYDLKKLPQILNDLIDKSEQSSGPNGLKPGMVQDMVDWIFDLHEQIAALKKQLVAPSLSTGPMEFLKDLMTRINTQDNRCTATPIYYTIHEQQNMPTAEDYADGSYWINEDGETVAYTAEELKKYLRETIRDLYSGEDGRRAKELLAMADLDESELSDWAEEGYDVRLVHFKKVDKYTGMFFTEKACEDHIAANRHHYTDPRSYVQHAWRNPEFERLLEILGELTGQPYIKH